MFYVSGCCTQRLFFSVNDWVYNSPIFGKAAKLAGAYPVSGGVENGEEYLGEKLKQGFSIIAFPEGTRSTSNKIKRFHKGAFYLAEKFQLDIIPVLIHGNSEVLPKGSFVIRDGSITVKILPRIAYKDGTYGENYSQQAKKLGAYFRKEFRKLCNDLETTDYWNKTLLENYQFKGDALYTNVKLDLANNGSAYHELLNIIPADATIIHLSKDPGQLDLLLSLDSIDRKLHTYLTDSNAKQSLSQNFLYNNYSKINLYDTPEDAVANEADILIYDLDTFSFSESLFAKFETIFLLKQGKLLKYAEVLPSDFLVNAQNDNFIVLNKKPTS
ncbi:1-acyl-sn-glycerol-3-phosphate acyltransferase [Maribacter litopenaei]|uniref:1-acyl-sn-glycerol-3-phosphate acyltransferase n=1 Tax=Maribacter litopenaei TaxID=2976127 RepID=A0ABY5YEF2_9FLAO|nr:lysophospholipid acyltransferase family protein [Maribacter litopenaei]UWX56672.1 1-acyl-sn-glycerol-3-phosphate acyltransferase [Maribacter litopenaei]